MAAVCESVEAFTGLVQPHNSMDTDKVMILSIFTSLIKFVIDDENALNVQKMSADDTGLMRLKKEQIAALLIWISF